MKRWGIRRIVPASPSKGKKRYAKRRPHKPGNVLPTKLEPRGAKVNRMLSVLKDGGWVFTYNVTAVSPRGFRYSAEGADVEEAFLKAFSLWRKDLLVPYPKFTVQPKPPEPVIPALQEGSKLKTSQIVHELVSRYGENISQIMPRWRKNPETFGKSQLVIYRRLYMRAYRAKKRLENSASLVLAA